jgi:hypothetical protein
MSFMAREEVLCKCNCGQALPRNSRYSYLPGHFEAAQSARLATVEAEGRGAPFNPLTQVSADAKYIVRNLVLWLLVLPFLLGLLVWGLSHMK